MKKVLSALLVIAMILAVICLAACGEEKQPETESQTEATKPEQPSTQVTEKPETESQTETVPEETETEKETEAPSTETAPVETETESVTETLPPETETTAGGNEYPIAKAADYADLDNRRSPLHRPCPCVKQGQSGRQNEKSLGGRRL